MNYIDIFYRQMEYIAKNSVKNGGTIVYAIHLGDIVESRDLHPEEWDMADKAMGILDGIVPYTLVPGNHDYDKWVRDEKYNFLYIDGSDSFNQHFGPESVHFKGFEHYKDSFNNGLNTFSVFSVDGREFVVLGLECEPSDDVLDWAQNILDKNKFSPTIFVTHEFLQLGYDYTTPGAAKYVSGNLRDEVKGNSPEQVFKKFISKNDQIFLVLCGHVFSGDKRESARTDINDYCNKVYELLSNYQGRQEILGKSSFPNSACGDGWLRLMEFDIPANKIIVRTYSTEMRKYETDYDSRFDIVFDWNWEERFPKVKKGE